LLAKHAFETNRAETYGHCGLAADLTGAPMYDDIAITVRIGCGLAGKISYFVGGAAKQAVLLRRTVKFFLVLGDVLHVEPGRGRAHTSEYNIIKTPIRSVVAVLHHKGKIERADVGHLEFVAHDRNQAELTGLLRSCCRPLLVGRGSRLDSLGRF
jgi:hypothetical protein